MRGLTEDHDTHMNPGDEERIRKQAPTGQQAEPTVMLPKVGSVPASMADNPGFLALERMAASVQMVGKVACWDHLEMFNVRDALIAALGGHQSERPASAGQQAEPGEVALIEKAAIKVGMKSLMNHGAASCVYTEGCNGVSQEHLIAFAREVALHCVAALAGQQAGQQAEPTDGWKEACIAWAVCGSIHREYAKGKDPFFKTRQGDFTKHEEDARAKALAGHQSERPAPAGQAWPDALPKRLAVSYSPGDWDTFIYGVSGHLTMDALAAIEKQILDDDDAAALFDRGPGDYLLSASRFNGQYGPEGQCEFAPGWELDVVEFRALAASQAERAEGKGEAS